MREVEENLSAKSCLVELLTAELEKKEQSAEEMMGKYQKEKHELESKITGLTKLADRVPILENELDKLQQVRNTLLNL